MTNLYYTPRYALMSPLKRIHAITMKCVQDLKDTQQKIEEQKKRGVEILSNEDRLGDTNVVIVMGESASRSYMHSYGYPLQTTPRIDSVIDEGNLVLFKDAVSPVPMTAVSITQILSYYQQEHEGKSQWYDFPTLPLIMSKAGYYSYWLSNQENMGSIGGPIASLAITGDTTEYMGNRVDMESLVDYDEVLIPRLKSREIALTNKRRALFEVVHIMGSHYRYADRFPKSFAKFTPNDLPQKSPYNTPVPQEPERRQLIADYINSIYYTDYVLSSIIKRYQDESSIVIYLSDHAETLFDDPRKPDYFMHDVSLQGLAVPFFVYFSPKAKERYPEVWEQVNRAKDRRIMTDLLTNSLCGLLGIRTKYYSPKYDFFSDEYNNDRKRLIRTYEGNSHIEL